MANHVVLKDNEGLLTYKGMLTESEISDINKILDELKKEIPKKEKALKRKYGDTKWYKYYLGKYLGELIEKYGITVSERKGFWDEIKTLASTEERTRDEGINTLSKSFFQHCYELSQLDKKVVEKLSWWQWRDLLDRETCRKDKRIYRWLGQTDEKFGKNGLREFFKALNLFLKGKDSSVFSDEELFGIYDGLLLVSKEWMSRFNEYTKDNPSVKKENRKLSLQYYTECLSLKKKLRTELTEEICEKAFSKVIK